jgi:hypothetical protein
MFASGRGYCFKSYGHISDIENNSLNACIVKTIAFVLFVLVGLNFNPTNQRWMLERFKYLFFLRVECQVDLNGAGLQKVSEESIVTGYV